MEALAVFGRNGKYEFLVRFVLAEDEKLAIETVRALGYHVEGWRTELVNLTDEELDAGEAILEVIKTEPACA